MTRILLVEDQPTLRQLVSEVLELSGYQVTVTFTLTGRRDATARRPYLAMWVESQTGASSVRMLTVWVR